jgi:hypothetical protein
LRTAKHAENAERKQVMTREMLFLDSLSPLSALSAFSAVLHSREVGPGLNDFTVHVNKLDDVFSPRN